MAYYKKGERVLLNGKKYTVKKVLNGPRNTFFYLLTNSDLNKSIGPIIQDRLKKLHVPAGLLFRKEWRRVFK